MEKKFIQVHEANPIGASPAFVPAGFEKLKVRVEVRPSVPPDWPNLDLGRSAQKFDRTIGGIVVINNDAIDERLIVPEEERDNAFFIPTSGVKIDGHENESERSGRTL
jgi:hypothetical protein